MNNLEQLVTEAVKQFNEAKNLKDFHEDWIIHINEEVGADLTEEEFEEFCWRVYEQTN